MVASFEVVALSVLDGSLPPIVAVASVPSTVLLPVVSFVVEPIVVTTDGVEGPLTLIPIDVVVAVAPANLPVELYRALGSGNCDRLSLFSRSCNIAVRVRSSNCLGFPTVIPVSGGVFVAGAPVGEGAPCESGFEVLGVLDALGDGVGC